MLVNNHNNDDLDANLTVMMSKSPGVRKNPRWSLNKGLVLKAMEIGDLVHFST